MGGWGPALAAAIAGLVGTTLLFGKAAEPRGPGSLSPIAGCGGVCADLRFDHWTRRDHARKARDDYRRSQEMFKEVALELKQCAADLQRADAIKSYVSRDAVTRVA